MACHEYCRLIRMAVLWTAAAVSLLAAGCGSLKSEGGVMGTDGPYSLSPSDDQLRVLVGKSVMVTLRGVDWGWLEGELVQVDTGALVLRATRNDATWGIPEGDLERLVAEGALAMQPEDPSRMIVYRNRVERVWPIGVRHGS